jgi:hypothetical protein
VSFFIVIWEIENDGGRGVYLVFCDRIKQRCQKLSVRTWCRSAGGWRSIEVLCRRGMVGVGLMKVLRDLRREDEALPSDYP